MVKELQQTEISGGEFTLFCIGGFFLAIPYGVTFLIPTLVGERGGDEALAGLIISAATVSTILLVVVSGHIADLLGSTKAVVISGLFLAASALGFAVIPSAGVYLTSMGFVLGIGWGVFYTLGPILLSALLKPERRVKFFALLSGSMMSGIGAGPIIGRIVEAFFLPIETAFLIACLAGLVGSALYYQLHRRFAESGQIMPHVSRIYFSAACRTAKSKAIYSIIMVGIGGAIFGGLSSFQTSYADQYGLDYSLFFIGFIITTIFCRLLVAGYIARYDPLYALVILTSLTLIAVVLFTFVTHSTVIYLSASVILGIGYGLTYSVINGLAANEAPEDLIPQSLLLFSLSYLVCVFGFPLIAGMLIVSSGIQVMMYVILLAAISSWLIALFRAAARLLKNRRKRHDM